MEGLEVAMKPLKEISEETKNVYYNLTNVKNDEKKRFHFRPFEPRDAYEISEIVREEYGNTYFKTYYYDPKKITEKIEKGEFDLFVFIDKEKDTIAAMEMLSYFREDGDDYIETASQIVREDFRGFGLARIMVEYLFNIAYEMNPAAIFMHGVTFHTVSQVIYVDFGMVPTGFRFGSFLTSKMENSYSLGKCSKYSEGVTILPIAKKDAGKVYLPSELSDFAEKIYKQMEATYEPVYENSGDNKSILQGESEVDINIDSSQRFIGVAVRKIGQDFLERIKRIIDDTKGEEDWVVQLTLNIDSPSIFEVYEKLKSLQFFFTGLKPLCGAHERMYMQWIGDTDLMTDEYALTDNYKDIILDLKKISPKVKL